MAAFCGRSADFPSARCSSLVSDSVSAQKLSSCKRQESARHINSPSISAVGSTTLFGVIRLRPARRSRIARRFGRHGDWLGSSLRGVSIAVLLLASVHFADVGSAGASQFDLDYSVNAGPMTPAATLAATTTATAAATPATPAAPKNIFAPWLDKWAEVKVDSDTENEYWVLGELPLYGPVRILRKETSVLEVIVSGFLAGFVVELSTALLLHPLDTLKTRLQTGQGPFLPDPVLYKRLYDGFLPVFATVPALSVFWAVKDIVRRSLIGVVKASLPLAVADVLSSTLASACGEAAYVAVKTPGQVLKIEQQAALFEEDRVRQRYGDEDNSYTSKSFNLNFVRLWEEQLSNTQLDLGSCSFCLLRDSGPPARRRWPSKKWQA